LADRVYGRLTEAGLKSYAQSAYDQLRITEIRKGSVELIIAEAVSHFQDATPLVILWLFLRYVPGILQSASEASKNVADAYRSLQEGKLVAQNRKQLEVKSLSEVTKSYADAYKSLEEGKLARQNRKRLKQEMKQDQSLQDLNTKRLNQLVLLLDDLQIDV